MVCYSDDSSDSGKRFYEKKDKASPVNRRGSDQVSTTHGIVVTNRSPSRKSPSKQTRNRNDSQTSNNPRIAYSSDDEQVGELNITNIKVEQFSSDNESEPIFQSPNASRARKHSFDDDEDKEAVSEDQDKSISRLDDEETVNDLSQVEDKKPIKRRKIGIKKEQISEDEEPTSRKDPEKLVIKGALGPRKNISELKSSEQEAGGNGSDVEIPPSQFWLHRFKEIEEEAGEKRLMKVTKKSSPTKSLNSDESVDDKKRPSLKTENIVKKELSQRKSPPRVMKTEIISRKYERIDSRVEKDEDESYLEKDQDEEQEKEKQDFVGLRESRDDEIDEKILSKNLKPEDVSGKKLSPVKKKQSPKKAEASPKRKLSSEPKMINNSGSEAKLNANKKNSPKQNSAQELNNKPLKSKLNICDNDTPSEEEKEEEEEGRVEKEDTPKKYVLALQKPKNSSKKTPSTNGTQLVLVRKTNSEVVQNAESNISDKSQSSPQKASVSLRNDEIDKDLSGDSSSDAAASPTMEKKVSPKKKGHDIDSSDEAEPSVKQAINQKQQTNKRKNASGLTPVTLKRKPGLEDSSSNEKASELKSVPKTPLRRKLPESDISEPQSNKRAKLMPSAKQPAHTMSDSDETDTLTSLNTMLNKSMLSMEDKAEEKVKLSKSRKSVSINTKGNLTHTPNGNKSRKSILKKPEPVATNDSSESVESSQEQQTAPENIQENVEPVITPPKIIKRPLNLGNLKDQESLAYDSTKASFALEDVSDDDEIYIVEVPRSVDPKELKGQTIRLGGKNKLQIGDELYETCDKDATNISCVFRTNKEHNSYRTVNLRPAGCINFRQRLSKNLRVELSSLEKKTVPFPKNLKIRHPLFGAEYENKIVITDEKVSKKISRPVVKRESITKTKKVSKVEKSPKKLKNLVKYENEKVDHSLELNKIKNNSKDKTDKSRQHDGTDSASSDSDSDVSFFQKIKRENIVKDEEKGRKSKNSLGILNLDEEKPSTRDLPIHLEETVTAVKRKELSASKKFGLSLNSSIMKNNSFDANTNTSQFFSSTPIKVEYAGKDCEGEILTNKVRKRKTHSDIVKGTTSPKKVKTN